MKLFMLLLGCRPTGRYTEQHDIFFGLAEDLRSLIPSIINYWPEAKGNIHVDAWREVKFADGFEVIVQPRVSTIESADMPKLFFVNLGGYKAGEFDEFHYKMLVVSPDLKTAQQKARETAFYKHMNIEKSSLHPKATAHIDDKYGVDVDNIYAVKDILNVTDKALWQIVLRPVENGIEDDVNLGYFKLSEL